ncbi:hypothetical protein NLI96_g4331 [Meripilus lineatus]|uniref:Extracellular metalloproteinase n=1 Tax=Meripilus lineatus TaxID=2056292 RepID=A0AAD5V579_9APHY|nr:hypothetical protein NLI96_g4331 [Physisporinus lineatus]
MFTNKLFTSVVLAVILASSSSAAPSPPSPQHATHRVHKVKADSEFTAYYPKSDYKTFGKGQDHPLSKRAGDDLAGDAVKFVESQLHLSPQSVVFKSGFSNDVGKHAYLRQLINGVPVTNAPAHVVFGNDGKVTAFGNSFIKPSAIASTTPSINVQDAIQRAEAAVNGTYNQHPPTIEYVAKENGSVVLAHVLQVENEHSGAFVEAFIDAHSGELTHLNNFVAEASYRVVPITKQYLTQGFETLVDPQDLTASPEGWHSDGRVSTITTSGNNAIAFKGTLSAVTTQSSAPLNFIFNQTASQQPSVQVNLDAARTNAFYVVNTVHDISYKYGFKENAFNFQNNNFGKGGYGSDRVTISVQDSSGTNNANFATPPDGQSGRMRMYLFVITNPFRDGALENDIVIHEYTHGITNRLTGGGTANCLQTYESAGLGEGWSDAMAEYMFLLRL